MARRIDKTFTVTNPTKDKRDIITVLEAMKDPSKLVIKIRSFVTELNTRIAGRIELSPIREIEIPRISDSEIDEAIQAVKDTPDSVEAVTTMLAVMEAKSYVESNDRLTFWNYSDALIDSVLESRGLKQVADSVIYTITDLVAIYYKEA